MAPIDVSALTNSQFNSLNNFYESKVSISSAVHILSDPKNKIAADFKVPSILRPSVEFWLKIYTEYSSEEVVIFDSSRLNLIYEVIDLKKISAIAKSEAEFSNLSNHAIQSTVKSI